jgi:O-antigen/teichoic acid export membrane protein
MGVIQRQSIKQGLVTYLGIIIGAVSTLFVYPNLGAGKWGEIQNTISMAAFFVPFFGVGLSSVSIHFFAYFKETKERRGRFLFILLAFTLLSLIGFCLFIYFNTHTVSVLFPENAYLFINYLPYILSIAFCVTFITLLQAYISNFSRIVIPSILYNISLKVLQPILVLIFLGGFMSFSNIFDGLVVVHILIVLCTVYYLYHIGYLEINTKKVETDPKLKHEMINYSFFSIMTNVSASLALQIDKILIAMMVGSVSLGVFQIPVLITEAIDVIRKAISGVSAPIISDSLKTNNIENVNVIYKKSALLQFTVGMFLLIGAWICADDLYRIMPKGHEFVDGKIIILILGLARLVDMLTGTNTEIIAFSQYYRANLYMLVFLAVTNITFNIILLKQYGNVGSAIATLISMILFNAAKLIFIYKKMKIHPFTRNMLGAILIALFTLCIAFFIPTIYSETLGKMLSFICTIALKGLVISVCYFALLWHFKISNDINAMMENIVKKIF